MNTSPIIISVHVAVVCAINDDPSKAAEICAQSGSDGTLVAHKDCHQFYKCYLGVPYAISCGPVLVFNPEKSYCDWAENYPCRNQQVEVTTVSSSTTNAGVSGGYSDRDPSNATVFCTEEGSNGLLISNEDCGKFYKCFQGQPIVFDCPANLYFNPALNVCDWPENVDCENDAESASGMLAVRVAKA